MDHRVSASLEVGEQAFERSLARIRPDFSLPENSLSR